MNEKIIRLFELWKQQIEQNELQWNLDKETETYFLNLIKEIDDCIYSLRNTEQILDRFLDTKHQKHTFDIMNEDKEILEIFSKLEDEDFENLTTQQERECEFERTRTNKDKMAWVRKHKKLK